MSGRGTRSLPNLSPAQERVVWRLLEMAWGEVRVGVMASVPAGVSESRARDAWRRQTLHETTGLLSMRELPRAGEALVVFLAKLEELGRAGIEWQLRRDGAAARPGVWKLRELLARLGIAETYAAGVAGRVLGREGRVDLDAVSAEEAARLVRFFEAQGLKIVSAVSRT